MYNGARLILALSLSLSAKREKKGEKERVPPYRECLRGLVRVLGDQKEEKIRGGRRSLSRANHLHAPLEFLQVLSWRKGKYIKP